jgi:hypothetical protein
MRRPRVRKDASPRYEDAGGGFDEVEPLDDELARLAGGVGVVTRMLGE